MSEYRVIWEIDIEAETAEDAARQALEIQRNPESIATVFGVAKRLPGGLRTRFVPIDVDVGEVECVH